MTELLAGKRALCFLGLGLLLFSVRIHPLAAKDKKPKGTTPPEITFRVNVNLVTVNVNVTDKRGVPVPDLTEKDFQVLDNGVLQKIAVFRVETVSGTATPVPSQGPNTPAPPVPTAASRKVILFVDDYSTRFEDLVYVRKAGEQFIRNSLGPADLVALITASGRFSTEFTTNREYLISALKQVLPLFTSRERSSVCPPMTEEQAILIEQAILPKNEMDKIITATMACLHLSSADEVRGTVEMTAQRLANQSAIEARQILAAVQTLVRRLQAIPGLKEIIFLSEGFFTAAVRHELNRVIDGAIRSNTVVDSIEARGLTTDDSPRERFLREDVMSVLATETGGKFYRNSNDLFGLMEAAIRRSSVHYILGFYPSDERYDGQFHKLAVKVDRPGVSVLVRKGYFAPKGEESLEAMSSEKIRNVLDNSEEWKDVPISLSFNIAHGETPESLVEVRARVDVKHIRFRTKERKNQETLRLVIIVYDSANQFVDGREAHLDFNLTDPHYQEILRAGLVWQAKFKLSSGHYMVKTAVHEAGEGKLGSAFKPLEISE